MYNPDYMQYYPALSKVCRVSAKLTVTRTIVFSSKGLSCWIPGVMSSTGSDYRLQAITIRWFPLWSHACAQTDLTRRLLSRAATRLITEAACRQRDTGSRLEQDQRWVDWAFGSTWSDERLVCQSRCWRNCAPQPRAVCARVRARVCVCVCVCVRAFSRQVMFHTVQGHKYPLCWAWLTVGIF